MRLTLFFLSLELTCNFGWAEEENFSVNENIVSVAALEGLPSSIVGGSVCAISGLYIDHSTDFVLLGPESLIFERTYSSAPLKGNMGIGWNSNHRDWLHFERTNHEKEDVRGCLLIEPSGAHLFYKCPYDHHDDKYDNLHEHEND